MKISGIGYVYMIISPSNRVYIGSTIDLDQRFLYYKNTLAKTQIKLYRSFKKYGWENHIFEIIWAGSIEDMLKYETLIGWGFNVLEPENLNCRLPKLGDIYSCINEETREKMSVSAKNKPTISNETRLKISNFHKGRKHSISQIRNRANSYKGNKHSIESKIKMSIAKLGIKRTEETNIKISNARKIPILQYDLKDVFIREWDSATDASKELKINNKHISMCCRGKRKTIGGFKWKLKE